SGVGSDGRCFRGRLGGSDAGVAKPGWRRGRPAGAGVADLSCARSAVRRHAVALPATPAVLVVRCAPTRDDLAGWLATARPPAGAVDYGLATCWGDRLWPRPPAKGRPAMAKAPCKGVAGCYQGQPTGATARKGSSRSQSQPLAVWCPQGRPTAGRSQGAASSGQLVRDGPSSQCCPTLGQRHRLQERLSAGKGSRRLRRGDDDGAEGARGVRAILL
ncbi:hypothetical protein GW17_00042996, partial [Ensete ventricosum]